MTKIMEYVFRKATTGDQQQIWEILEKAIERRRLDGSNQWQDGYPNPAVVGSDIEKGYGFVLADGNELIGYCAVLFNDEPAYAAIKGAWVTNSDFLVYHRVAIAEKYLGKGLAQELLKRIEQLALGNNIRSVKADTNHDNAGMLKIFEKLGYVYCGEVSFRGSPRKAFEKVLVG
ncbi:MAG: GNAT family N-acetyltransferase [Chitinophagaceae bacterium]